LFNGLLTLLIEKINGYFLKCENSAVSQGQIINRKLLL
jgi:hypothetical protein